MDEDSLLEQAQARLMELRRVHAASSPTPAGEDSPSSPRPSATVSPERLRPEQREVLCPMCRKMPMSQTRSNDVAPWLPDACAACRRVIDARRATKLAEWDREAWERRFRVSRLHRSYAEIRHPSELENIPEEAKSALGAVTELLTGEASRQWLWLWGRSGVWKSRIADATLAAAIATGFSGIQIYWPDLMADLYDAMNSPEAVTVDAIERMKHVEKLVVNDLGKGAVTRYTLTTVDRIIQGREQLDRNNPHRWMIVTSNYRVGEIEGLFSSVDSHVADAIARRFTEFAIEIEL